MYNYTIKKNGYAIGQARGVHKAVERIRYEIGGQEGSWRSPQGYNLPVCRHGQDVYIMERETK